MNSLQIALFIYLGLYGCTTVWVLIINRGKKWKAADVLLLTVALLFYPVFIPFVIRMRRLEQLQEQRNAAEALERAQREAADKIKQAELVATCRKLAGNSVSHSDELSQADQLALQESVAKLEPADFEPSPNRDDVRKLQLHWKLVELEPQKNEPSKELEFLRTKRELWQLGGSDELGPEEWERLNSTDISFSQSCATLSPSGEWVSADEKPLPESPPGPKDGSKFAPQTVRYRNLESDGWMLALSQEFLKAVMHIDRKLQGRILEALGELTKQPMTARGDTLKPLSHELNGLWRYRLGDYRVIYQPIPERRQVLVVSFAPRGSAYA